MEFLKAAMQKSWDILRFRHYVMMEIAHSSGYNRSAIIIFLVPPAINFLLASVRFLNVSSYFMNVLLGQLVTVMIFVVVSSFLAKQFFHGQSPHSDYFRVMGHASLIYWLTIVPFLFMLVGLSGIANIYSVAKLVSDVWFTAVSWSALLMIHRLSSENTILTVVLSIVVTIVAESFIGF